MHAIILMGGAAPPKNSRERTLAPTPLPHPQIRNAFARLLLYACQESNRDPPYSLDPSFLSEKEAGCSFTEVILSRLLELLKREVPQHGRHLQQYFSFFMAFAIRTKVEVGRGAGAPWASGLACHQHFYALPI